MSRRIAPLLALALFVALSACGASGGYYYRGSYGAPYYGPYYYGAPYYPGYSYGVGPRVYYGPVVPSPYHAPRVHHHHHHRPPQVGAFHGPVHRAPAVRHAPPRPSVHGGHGGRR